MTRSTLYINLSVEKVFVMSLYITKLTDFIKILGGSLWKLGFCQTVLKNYYGITAILTSILIHLHGIDFNFMDHPMAINFSVK